MLNRLFRVLAFTGTLALMLMLPTLALAQDAAPVDGGIPVGPIAAIFAAIAGVAVAVSNYLPGAATYLNVVIGGATACAAVLTTMGDAAPTATVSAIVIACVGAIIGRARSETRAEA